MMINDELRTVVEDGEDLGTLARRAIYRVLDEHKLMREALEDIREFGDQPSSRQAANALAKVSK